MASLSISKAWEEGASFAGRELRLLFPVAFLFLALPPVLFNLILASQSGAEQIALQVERNGIGPVLLLQFGIMLVELVLSTLGSLTITYLALRPGTSVREGFGVALRRLLPALGAILLIAIVIVVIMFVFSLIVGASMLAAISAMGSGGGSAADTAGIFGATLLLVVLMILFGVALWAKLAPMTAVAVAEQRGPAGIIGQSWQLTRGHFWKLFGALLLIGIVYLMAIAAIGAILFSLVWAIVGNPATSATGAFVLSLLAATFTAIVSPFLLSFMARIYAQLSGRVGEVGEVFS